MQCGRTVRHTNSCCEQPVGRRPFQDHHNRTDSQPTQSLLRCVAQRQRRLPTTGSTLQLSLLVLRVPARLRCVATAHLHSVLCERSLFCATSKHPHTGPKSRVLHSSASQRCVFLPNCEYRRIIRRHNCVFNLPVFDDPSKPTGCGLQRISRTIFLLYTDCRSALHAHLFQQLVRPIVAIIFFFFLGAGTRFRQRRSALHRLLQTAVLHSRQRRPSHASIII